MATTKLVRKKIGPCSECLHLNRKKVIVVSVGLKMCPCKHPSKLDYFILDAKNYGCWFWEVKGK